MQSKLSVVTGAFGYTGRYIARRLLDQGESVRTLTRNPASRSPFGPQVDTRPLDFGNYEQLVASLTGADTFYNTYWIRFPRGSLTYETATSNSLLLFRAAVEAGIRRIVHISITNASEDSSLRYFRGKGVVERAIHESGLSYAILRPTVLYSLEDVLINNIAWFLRRFPVFPIAGSGDYPIQPVLVDDVARLSVELGARNDNVALDAVGPETFTFEELVRLLARRVGTRVWLMHLPPSLTFLASQMAGLLVRDVVLTKDEVDGLMAGLLVSGDAPTTSTRFTEWLRANGANVGRRYASELGRHYR
ncbi:MAG: NAD(P)H-binding protein [Chloroflexi bacterium]|nr:NAD(P)H-binding protein [Chloroflexota bacterium]MCY3938981.1 NAD(P)H-binding protein [Chloroflexota bacterium]